MKKTMITIAALLVTALMLVTCAPELLSEAGDSGLGDDGLTDVVYDTIGGPGNERVKSVTLYLDGNKVPKSARQSAFEKRALTLEGARMSHDFFEVVFMGNTPAVARASWELGQAAGISGVDRNTGTDYSGTTPGVGSSIIFVGKKSSKTLLGVGYLTHINNEPIDGALEVDGDTTSVTFTVSPLGTWLGFDGTDVNTTRSDLGGPPPDPFDTEVGTFITATDADPADAAPLRVYTPADLGDTTGSSYEPFTGVSFPIFYLPDVKGWPVGITSADVDAVYTVGGLDEDTTGVTDLDLTNAVRVYGKRGESGAVDEGSTSTAAVKGGLQFIKRTPAFMYNGITYEANSAIDRTTTLTETALIPDDPFTGELNIKFKLYKGSNGIFAITFQVPVYALTILAATNTGSLLPEKWWIRPDYGQYQYLLDNGKDAGGAVLLGVGAGSAADWIQINTVGVGFDNE